MTVLSTDTFTRLNQAGFGTSTSGEAWNYAGANNTESIVSNEGVFSSVAGDSFAVLGSNSVATVNILVRLSTDDSWNFIGALARYSNTGGITAYRAGLYNQTIQVDRYISGVRSSVGSKAFSYTPGSSYWFRFVVDGSSLSSTVWADGASEPGTPTLVLEDTTIPGPGQYGVSTFLFSGDTRVDHLTVTDNQPDIVVPSGIPLAVSLSTAQSLTLSFSRAQLAQLFLTTTQHISISVEVRMSHPNSTVTSTALVQDSTGTALTTLSQCDVTVSFPDGTSSSFSLSDGVENLGTGHYAITYNTKGPGRIQEEWKITASDGTTKTDYLNFYTVAY